MSQNKIKRILILEREFFKIKEKLNDIIGVLFWENCYAWDQFQSVTKYTFSSLVLILKTSFLLVKTRHRSIEKRGTIDEDS
jgi:hypothetical protein